MKKFKNIGRKKIVAKLLVPSFFKKQMKNICDELTTFLNQRKGDYSNKIDIHKVFHAIFPFFRVL